MAKPKKEKPEGTETAVKRIAFTGHRRNLMAAGEVLTHTSRPSGKEYQLEEWLNADRAFTYRKVYDSGRVVTFVEQSVEDRQGQE